MTNQIAANTSLDLWAQSGGAFDTVMTDVTAAADAELQAGQPSLARVCAPALTAAAVTIGVTCGGWEPALKSAAYTHTIQCRGGW
ncbi:hypothetical protein [Thalassospira aquimaris]|nr:hypothetical protein [Thalassospira sp. FZY0004]